MANNLRYLLEHFCLDGQKIDISSQLDEENANNIEKINTQTVPSINARIDDIKNTDIPNINSRIDNIKNTDIPSINQKINTINNSTIPSVQENVSAVNEKADRINESVAKNTRDIGTLSDNVTMQGNAINSINTEKIPSVEHNVNELTSKVSTNTDNINSLTTKVDTNTDSINELSTKVNTNTDSINTINNTSIPHLQSEIDNLSGGGTGSVGELREKVEKNTTDISTLTEEVETNTTAIGTINDTSIPNLQNQINNLSGGGTGSIGELREKVEKNTADISELNGKVESNTTAISTINNTSIPNLQTEINNLKTSNTWQLIHTEEISSEGIILTAKEYTNGIINYLNLIFNFKNVVNIKLNYSYLFLLKTITPPTLSDVDFASIVTFIYKQVGTTNLNVTNNKTGVTLALSDTPNFTSIFDSVIAKLFYF